MLLVVRASDGAAYPLYRSDLENITTLEELRFNLLSPLLQIPPECLICMNEEGAQLRNESVPPLALLAGSPSSSSAALPRNSSVSSTTLRRSGGVERRIFVFDRDHLDSDPEEVSRALAISEEHVLDEAPLAPQDPLSSHVGLSHHNIETHRALISSIALQRASLQLAVSNLNRVMTGTSTSLSLFLETASPSLEAWTKLLEGWENSMDAVGKVSVVNGLIGRSGHSRDGSIGVSSGLGKEKERFLGDYVSREKMVAVRDGCANTLVELKDRTEELKVTLDDVLSGTEAVQAEYDATSRDLEDLEACEQDAEHAHARIEELVRAGEDMTDPDLLAQGFEELAFFDSEHRDRIRFLVERKNAMTRYLVQSMQRISHLQSEIAEMPVLLAQLDNDLRVKTDNFKHLARLEGLIPAYVATVVEVVRRREYSRLLHQHSSGLSDNVAHISALEQSRRATYRSNFSGKLPWEVRGLSAAADEAIPAISFDVQNAGQDLPELGRDAIQALRQMLVDLPAVEGSPLATARRLLDDLEPSLDELSAEFERLHAGEATAVHSSGHMQRVEDRLHQLEEANERLERELQSERSGREEDTAQLEQRHALLAASREADQVELRRLQQDLSSAQRRLETSRQEQEQQKETSANALKNATDEYHLLQLALRQAEQDSSRKMEDLETRHADLVAQHSSAAGDLARYRTLVEELERAIASSESTQRELIVAIAEKDRSLRDQKGEAELDRAVLERELDKMRAQVGRLQEDARDRSARASTLEDIADGLRSQIARWEKVVDEGRKDLQAARDESERARQEKERTIVAEAKETATAKAIARRAVKTAIKLRTEHEKIITLLNSTTALKPDSVSIDASPVTIESQPPVESTALDVDTADLEELLANVGGYNIDALADAVRTKVDALTLVTKKWIKEAKAYRERAHRAATAASDKIAFRNFAKGDLALFLPTRNSAVPVWAAFNVSFPHHFLSASGAIAEQMKTREWIVARITSLTQNVADAKEPTSNPYQLAAGTKYTVLEVETWSSKEGGSRSRRQSSTDKGKSSSIKLPSRSMSMSGKQADASAVLATGVDASSFVPPPARRSVSEGNILQASRPSTLVVSGSAIIEEAEHEAAAPQPQLSPGQVDTKAPSPFASGISISLARSTPSSPVQARTDPFSNSPFGADAAEVPDDSVKDTFVSPAPTDYEPTLTPAGAVPAFLPSLASRKAPSSSSSTGTSSGPRYVRNAARTSASGPVPIPDVSRSSSSPSSRVDNAKFQPRSASSGSSILSSSMHRRSGLPGSFPKASTSFEKALATQESQLSGSRWDLLQKDLAEGGQAQKGAAPSTARGFGNEVAADGRATNARSSSVLDALKQGATQTRPAGVEGEIRKLLRNK